MKKSLLLSIPLLILFSSCEQKNPITPTKETIPVLSQLVAPDTLYLVSAVEHFVSVHVEDPQGKDDIFRVTYSVFSSGSENAVKIDSLVDDGTKGDIIPLDGTYTNIINADFAQGQVGNYTITFTATDKSGNESTPLSHQLNVIAGEENIAPTISDVMLPSIVDIKDSLDYVISAKVNDPQGPDDIELVLLQIFTPTDNLPVFKDTLRDNGKHGDGIFSQTINPITFTKNVVGRYTFHFQAFDKAGEASNAMIRIVDVVNSVNSPPYIFNLNAPDTMKLLQGKTASTVLSISATDPQGLIDIREVYFNSYKPGGIPSQGNPFIMMDDGNEAVSGDKIAGDGTFSLRINLPPDTPTGDYTFIFEAVDKSDAKSNEITHIITVTQ